MGDNAQILTLADSLQGRVEVKQLRFNGASALPNVLLGASLASVAVESRRSLVPPWPSLVIASGRRSVPAARWVWRQSGGRTRLVHIGRPWAPLSWFDLVVTTPQYVLGPKSNVIHNLMPLTRPGQIADDEVQAQWIARLQHLPQPRIAVLVGGSSRPYVFDLASAERLARLATNAAEITGGSLMVTLGPRCDPQAVAAFERIVTVPAHIHVARLHGMSATENPYNAYLELADRFIITGESASLFADTVRTGKPVEVFQITKQPDLRSAWGAQLRRAATRPGLLGRICQTLIDTGVLTSVRDVDHYHRLLREAGLIGGGDAAIRRQAEELLRTIARVQDLLEEPAR